MVFEDLSLRLWTLKTRLALKFLFPVFLVLLVSGPTGILGSSESPFSSHRRVLERSRNAFRRLDDCTPASPTDAFGRSSPGTTPVFRQDVHTYVYPPKPVSQLPRVAVVTAAFGSSANQYRAELSAIACYCAYHGYPFYIEYVQLQSDRYFSFTKTRTVMKYMPHFQWIFYIDNDAVIVNRTKKLEEYMDDNYDLVLQKRDSNHEVHAAVFFVKNSEYGWFFMRKWIELSDNGQAPFGMGDNAALVIMTLMEVKPPGSDECLQIMYTTNISFPPRVRRQIYNSRLMTCFNNVMKTVQLNQVKRVKILAPLQGYLRSFQSEWRPQAYYAKLFPETDFVLHGKHLAVDLLIPADIYCEEVENGISRPDLFHTREGATAAARQMGYIYPPEPW